jgi:hypothetical protein
MKKRKSIFTKVIGLVARTFMRGVRIFLTKRAKLEALSAAIGWFVKRNNYQPLEFSHPSDYGDFDVMSDGTQIQLTWLLPDAERKRGAKQNPKHNPKQTSNHDKPYCCEVRAMKEADGDARPNDSMSMAYVVGDLAQTVFGDFDGKLAKDRNARNRR